MDSFKILKKIQEQSQNINYYMKFDIFQDDIFKPDSSSLGILYKTEGKSLDPMKNIPNSIIKKISLKDKNKPNQIKSDSSNIDMKNKFIWKRLTEVKKEVNLLKIKNRESAELISNVIQGALGDCYFISAICAFSETSRNIFNIFTKHYDHQSKNFRINKNGLYEVLVYVNGKKLSVLLDDFFPFLQRLDPNNLNDIHFEPAISIIDENSKNIWPLILEKAWAKVNGSYGNIIKGSIIDGLHFISPSAVQIYFNSHFYPDKFKEFHQILNQADDKKYIICADISEEIHESLDLLVTSMGLLKNHAYSVIEILELKTRDGDIQNLLKIRNPWGSLEWNGDWSDESPLWTEDLKKQAGFVLREDGYFYMNFEDFLKFFVTTYICTHENIYNYNYKKIKNNEKSSFFYFSIDLNSEIEGYLIVNLKSTKIRRNLNKDPNFENKYFSLFLFKNTTLKNQSDYSLINSIISNSDRISIDLKESPGKYILLVKIHEKENSYINNFERDFITDMHQFMFESLNEKTSFKVGIYSNISQDDYSIELKNLEKSDVESVNRMFVKSIEKMIPKLPNNVMTHFYEENEKETFRVLNFKNETTAFGILAYSNGSRANILEMISAKQINNIYFIPIYDETINSAVERIEINNKSHSCIEIEENIFDDDIENEFLKHIKDSEAYESDIEVFKTKSINMADFENENRIIKFKFRPLSKYYGLLMKNSENSDFDISSKISLKYPLSYIWEEKYFETKKIKLKYKEIYIPIIETIIKHNNGLIVKYKNKTTDFIAEIKLKMQNMKNIKAVKENLVYFDKIYESEAEGIIKIIDDNSCIMVVNPGELAFIEFSSIDIFEEIAYDITFNYNIYTV